MENNFVCLYVDEAGVWHRAYDIGWKKTGICNESEREREF